MFLRNALRICTFSLAAAATCAAQNVTNVALLETGALPFTDATSSSSTTGTSIAQAPPPADPRPLTARWLDLKTLTHDQRYRNAYTGGGFHLFENGQQRSLIEGRLKLDAEGRYAIDVRASSGRYFNWAYADYAGAGLGERKQNPAILSSFAYPQIVEIFTSLAADPKGAAELNSLVSNGWQFYVRELFFSATPVSPVTVEFGSFGVEKGLASEITTFDDDGYLSGERLRLKDPKHLFFDQIAYTNAFFGDVATPNFFERGSSLKQSNYRQIAAKKQFSKRAGVSTDYTWLAGTHTFREAAVIGTGEVKVIDDVRVEVYERTNSVNLQGLTVRGGSGFAVTGFKRAGKYLSGDFGYSSIDLDYSVYHGSRAFHAFGFSLNGDTYGQGDRFFTHAAVKISPAVTAFGFYTHGVGSRVLQNNQQGFNAGLDFNLKAVANAGRRVF